MPNVASVEHVARLLGDVLAGMVNGLAKDRIDVTVERVEDFGRAVDSNAHRVGVILRLRPR